MTKLKIEYDYITGAVYLETPQGFKAYDLPGQAPALLNELKRWDHQTRIKAEEAEDRAPSRPRSLSELAQDAPTRGGDKWRNRRRHGATQVSDGTVTVRRIAEGKSGVKKKAKRPTITLHAKTLKTADELGL